jgi:Flp pilus assembly pilin Flp
MTDRKHIPDIAALGSDETGQTMAEYGVVLAVITIGVVVAIGLLNVVIEGKFTDVGTMIVQLVPG